MADLVRSGASEGLWLRAERQTAGKGRQGREWASPEGNLYISTVVRIRPGEPAAATLALVAAVALQETIALFAVRPMIKWPNDLLVNGAKLSGILLERVDDAVIVGFGVNLAHCPVGLGQPATSVSIYAPPPEPQVVADTLAEIFARWLSRWRDGIAPVRERWLARAHPIGTALTARLADGTSVDGLFDGLTSDGALMLRLADGTVRAIHAGDVFLL